LLFPALGIGATSHLSHRTPVGEFGTGFRAAAAAS
jgi:hypothetical protein